MLVVVKYGRGRNLLKQWACPTLTIKVKGANVCRR